MGQYLLDFDDGTEFLTEEESWSCKVARLPLSAPMLCCVASGESIASNGRFLRHKLVQVASIVVTLWLISEDDILDTTESLRVVSFWTCNAEPVLGSGFDICGAQPAQNSEILGTEIVNIFVIPSLVKPQWNDRRSPGTAYSCIHPYMPQHKEQVLDLVCACGWKWLAQAF